MTCGMDLPLRGLALGEAVLAAVAEDEAHDQSTIMTLCGTRGCIAGWTIVLGVADWTRNYLGVAHTLAPRLLGLNAEAFQTLVYDEVDDATAISNFRMLLDERYPEPQAISLDDVVGVLVGAR